MATVRFRTAILRLPHGRLYPANVYNDEQHRLTEENPAFVEWYDEWQIYEEKCDNGRSDSNRS